MQSAMKKQDPARHQMKVRSVLTLLRVGHKLVSGLFVEYGKARLNARKLYLVSRICSELTVHAQVKEEIFYPAITQALKDEELIPEIRVKHATLEELIGQVDGIEPDGEMFDARIKVLWKYVKHLIQEEQKGIFQKVQATGLDIVDLGIQLASRMEELLAQRPRPMNHPNRTKRLRPMLAPSGRAFNGAF